MRGKLSAFVLSKPFTLLVGLTLSVCVFARHDPNTFDPDNAAHWYRKAFALYEGKSDSVILRNLRDFIADDIELTPELKKYFKQHKPIIDLIVKASQVKHCDWQYDHFKDIWQGGTNDYSFEVVQLCVLTLAYTKYTEQHLAHSQIMDNIQMCFDLAQRINKPYFWNYTSFVLINETVYVYVEGYLCRNPAMSIEDLTTLYELLVKERGRNYYLLTEILDSELEFAKIAFTEHTDQKFDAESDPHIVRIITFKGESGWDSFFKKTLSYFENHINNLRNALKAPISSRYSEIRRVEQAILNECDVFLKKFGNLPEDFIPEKKDHDEFMNACGILYPMNFAIAPFYYAELRMKTGQAALLTGIPLLIEYQKSRQLPDNIPSDSPNDAFGNQPFEFIKLDSGFLLKSRSPDFREDKYHEYKFELPKE